MLECGNEDYYEGLSETESPSLKLRYCFLKNFLYA